MATFIFVLQPLFLSFWVSKIYCTAVSTDIDYTDIQQKGTNFQFEMITNVIDHTLVTKTFYFDKSQNCAFKCATFSSTVSLYYDEGTKTCYCNNQHDNNRVLSTADNSLLYAYVVKTSLTLPIGECIDCSDLSSLGFRVSGPYEIRTLKSSTTRELFCDLAEEWTTFQRRYDGSVDFYRDWDNYVDGFGSPSSGEFWLGLEEIHTLTTAGSCELVIYLEAECDIASAQSIGFARYSSFSVDSAATNYTLHLSGFSGNVGDCMGGNDGHPFTTSDVDNDVDPNRNCAETFKGGWWYSNCGLSNLNGQYFEGSHISYFDGIEWSSPWGFHYSLLKTEMKFKCAPIYSFMYTP